MTTPAKATSEAIAAVMLIHHRRIRALYYRNPKVINDQIAPLMYRRCGFGQTEMENG